MAFINVVTAHSNPVLRDHADGLAALSRVARRAKAADRAGYLWPLLCYEMPFFVPAMSALQQSREPDYVIGTKENPYLFRWHILRAGEGEAAAQLYLHMMVRDDDDRALHDHPWDNISIPIYRGYYEHTPEHPKGIKRHLFQPIVREATQLHRIRLTRDSLKRVRPAWSLFLTGPKVREWGFDCPNGWRHWKEFTAGPDGAEIGKGCD